MQGFRALQLRDQRRHYHESTDRQQDPKYRHYQPLFTLLVAWTAGSPLLALVQCDRDLWRPYTPVRAVAKAPKEQTSLIDKVQSARVLSTLAIT